LAGYPDLKDDPELTSNVKFYRNEIPSQPGGEFIDNMHRQWNKDYNLLEIHHDYIQWMFPIREAGVNPSAQILQLHEAKVMSTDPKIQERFVRSYEMMLDFYGIKLIDKKTGEVQRSKNYQERYAHLNNSSHNERRITRIFKCLGELGFEHYKLPLLRHFLKEVVEGHLRNNERAFRHYWLPILRSKSEREIIAAEYAKYRPPAPGPSGGGSISSPSSPSSSAPPSSSSTSSSPRAHLSHDPTHTFCVPAVIGMGVGSKGLKRLRTTQPAPPRFRSSQSLKNRFVFRFSLKRLARI